MFDSRRGWILRYGVALLATIVALVVRLVLGRLISANSPFLFFTPAVMLAAWFGGIGPGLLATFVGAILGNYFLLDPPLRFSFDPDDLGRLAVFVLVGVQIAWLSGEMHRAKHHALQDAQAARRSERLYRTLASNFPDGFVCLFDEELRWTLVAGAGLADAGLRREQMEGRTIDQTFPAAAATRIRRLCASAIEGGSAVEDVAVGDRVYFVHALPLKPDGDAARVGMAILEDVTERAKARQALQWAHDDLERRVRQRTSELRFQKTLLESQNQASRDGILALDNDGRIIFANNRFRELWGIGQLGDDGCGDTRIHRVRELMREQCLSSSDPLSSAPPSPGIVAEKEGIEELILRDGRTIERYSAAVVDPDGTSYGRVWFFRDTTERKRLQREILEAAERERQRIGQDLHDDLCQHLAGVACLGRVLQQRLAARPGDEMQRDAFEALQIVQLVQESIGKARDLARGLQPVVLQSQGLSAALQELCSSIETMFHVSCSVRCGSGDEVDSAVAAQLYRIAQEAISNAIRHGHAKHVLLDLVGVDGRVILSIEDDGTGIADEPLGEGLGLQTMSYRARMVGGSVTIERRRGGGTTVTCSVDSAAAVGSSGASPAATPKLLATKETAGAAT